MKHAIFTIIHNEIPHLEQKLDFLYKNFDQIIFYDLYVGGPTSVGDFDFSTDGSHEYIKKYYDPDKKITLIEQRDLSNIKPTGLSNIYKQKMFTLGSTYVNDDIDVFWCFDMDEYFNQSLIGKVEDVFNKTDSESVVVDFYNYYKNEKYILTEYKNNKFNDYFKDYVTRIVKHKKNNIYGHCSLHYEYPKQFRINDEVIHHFGFVGENKMNWKRNNYNIRTGFFSMYDRFSDSIFDKENINDYYGYPNAHMAPYIHCGVTTSKEKIPEYIDIKKLIKKL